MVALLTSLKSVFAPRRMALRPFTVPSIDVSQWFVALVATWCAVLFTAAHMWFLEAGLCENGL